MKKVQILNSSDVISISATDRHHTVNIMSNPTFLAIEFWNAFREYYELDKLMEQGVACSILSPEQKWQTGKFKVVMSIAFYPDEAEEAEEAEAIESEADTELEYRSPLDEIREMVSPSGV